MALTDLEFGQFVEPLRTALEGERRGSFGPGWGGGWEVPVQGRIKGHCILDSCGGVAMCPSTDEQCVDAAHAMLLPVCVAHCSRPLTVSMLMPDSGRGGQRSSAVAGPVARLL